MCVTWAGRLAGWKHWSNWGIFNLVVSKLEEVYGLDDQINKILCADEVEEELSAECAQKMDKQSNYTVSVNSKLIS